MENDPKDCPYYLISRATLVLTATLKRALAGAGVENVRPAYLGVLMCLWQEDGVKAVELGKCAGLEPSSVTGLVDRMERDGLVERVADPDDRRAQRIRLTAEGKRVRKPVNTVVLDALSHLMDDVPEKDVERVKSVLRRVLNNAQKMGPS